MQDSVIPSAPEGWSDPLPHAVRAHLLHEEGTRSATPTHEGPRH